MSIIIVAKHRKEERKHDNLTEVLKGNQQGNLEIIFDDFIVIPGFS